MNINMKNEKRQSGKTTKLKQKILEDMMNCIHSKYVIITHNRNMMREYERWSNGFLLIDKNIVDIVVEPLDLECRFRGLSDHCVGVYIDEPFIIPKEKQNEFLRELEFIDTRNSVNVYGIGTRAEQPEQTFEDYLKD